MNTKVTVASGIHAPCAKLVDLINESALKRTAREASMLAAGLLFAAGTAIAQPVVYQTPVTPMELPVEVEIELSPAGSLKQAPLWKELYQMLKNPYAVTCPNPAEPNACMATIPRRPGFGVAMPPLNIYSLGYNFLTGQPMRARTSDGEVSWDQPGPLFDREQSCLNGTITCDAFNTPIALRTVIGHLVACPNVAPGYQAATIPATFCNGKFPGGTNGSLVVYNPGGHPDIPPNGTVVAVNVYFDGLLHEIEDGVLEPIDEFEAPVNEEDFFRDPADTTGIPVPMRPYIGRLAAEVLGKALFWDMQIGSDGVQACGSCHFHAGVDNRTRGQLNPNTLGGTDRALQIKGPNMDVVASDFPFQKRNPDTAGDGATNCGLTGLPACTGGVTTSDSSDVMSSMGVSKFKRFLDIPVPGATTAFMPPANGVAALKPDIGDDTFIDPVTANVGFRRVEPRHTPTFHGAAFNFDNFWDGRARFNFNGGSVFGPSDPTAHIFINPGLNTAGGAFFGGANNRHIRADMLDECDPPGSAADASCKANQPVRITFSSLASQSVGPPLSDFEMSFAGRNWAKIGKKMLQGQAANSINPPNIQNFGNSAPQAPGPAGQRNRQNAVAPLANQLVAVDDSRLGPFSNQGGSACAALEAMSGGTQFPTAAGKPGLCVSYPDLIRLAFSRQFWNRANRHLNGAAGPDPFDGYALTVASGASDPALTNQFSQMEANFSLFFALSVQAYESLTIPDHTPADQFFDANPNAGHGVGEPGDQAVLFPTLIPDFMDDGQLNGSAGASIVLVPGFGADEVFGFDLFAGANLTAALDPLQSTGSAGIDRNPLITNSLGQQIRVGSNPFTRSAKCMLCHLGPEQTDHSINISHGLLKNDAEFEYPTPPSVPDPQARLPFPNNPTFADRLLPAPEPSGQSRSVGGLILAEEVGEGPAQDAVEVEPRNFASFDDPLTPWDDRIIAQPGNFAFGDQGVYNIGLRPVDEDSGRGGSDPFGWPLSLSALTLMNIGQGPGGILFQPCVGAPGETPAGCAMSNFDPTDIGGENGGQGFEETGDGAFYPGTTYTLDSINPGFERDPIDPQLPVYLRFWVHSLPAGELHPQIDEMAGMVPNTITAPNGGPGIEFPEILFGADFHCAAYNPALFGDGPPNFGWGPPDATTADQRLCPQNQSGVAGNHQYPSQGTWPVPNRVLANGAFKAPALRNVELTGPYFHTGSYLTLRQVVDFYMRGGDFPILNAANRDPHIVAVDHQTFAFGTSNLIGDVDYTDVQDPYGILQGSFADGLPDTVFLYNAMPDSTHPITPERNTTRAIALEDAKNSIVKFLIALTDPRVKFEKAPFDRPQIFVPIDGAAPENTLGPGTGPTPAPGTLLSLSGVPCTPASTGICFRNIPAVGAGGNAAPLPAFLGVTNIPPGAPGYNCNATGGAAVSHFCRVVTTQ